jgi:hypothetical protein
MGRGIERAAISRGDPDRADCVARLAALCGQGHLGVYSWTLLPDRFYLLVRVGGQPLFRSLRRLLTGNVVDVTRRPLGTVSAAGQPAEQARCARIREEGLALTARRRPGPPFLGIVRAAIRARTSPPLADSSPNIALGAAVMV